MCVCVRMERSMAGTSILGVSSFSRWSRSGEGRALKRTASKIVKVGGSAMPARLTVK